jgi:hypothetical protein
MSFNFPVIFPFVTKDCEDKLERTIKREKYIFPSWRHDFRPKRHTTEWQLTGSISCQVGAATPSITTLSITLFSITILRMKGLY